MNQSFPPGVVHALAEHYDADEIWLFGSRVAGGIREDSDWDVLVLLPKDADKSKQSTVPGNKIIGNAGIRGDVHHMRSDVFHAGRGIPNSLPRIIGETRELLYRRDGFIPAAITQEEAIAAFTGRLRNEASDYLAAASVLNGKHYGRINLLRFAARNILVALLTLAGDHVGSDAYRIGGKMVMLRRLPQEVRSSGLDSGIAFLDRLNSFDLVEIHEFISQPSDEDNALLDELHITLARLLDSIS